MIYQGQQRLNDREHREKLLILARSVVNELSTPALKLQIQAELERQAANNRVQLQQLKPTEKELAAAHPELSAKPTAQTSAQPNATKFQSNKAKESTSIRDMEL